MVEVGTGFVKYKLALALIRRAQDQHDLADAVSDLTSAKIVFSRLAETDSKNSWWPLICTWIERALGEAYRKQHEEKAARSAYYSAIERDQNARRSRSV